MKLMTAEVYIHWFSETVHLLCIYNLLKTNGAFSNGSACLSKGLKIKQRSASNIYKKNLENQIACLNKMEFEWLGLYLSENRRAASYKNLNITQHFKWLSLHNFTIAFQSIVLTRTESHSSCLFALQAISIQFGTSMQYIRHMNNKIIQQHETTTSISQKIHIFFWR